MAVEGPSPAPAENGHIQQPTEGANGVKRSKADKKKEKRQKQKQNRQQRRCKELQFRSKEQCLEMLFQGMQKINLAPSYAGSSSNKHKNLGSQLGRLLRM